MRWHQIRESADERQAGSRKERRQHVQAPELAMAQIEYTLPLGNGCRNEIGLAEAGEVRQRETTRDPAPGCVL